MDEKKSVKKRILHWVLVVAIACVLALAVLFILMIPVIKGDVYYTNEGRQTRQDNEDIIDDTKVPDDIEDEPPTLILVELRNEDIFDKGYYAYYLSYDISDTINIGSNNDPESDIEWKIYVSDIELSEEEIYALEETEPIAINEGEVLIERDKWIYILCNVNAQTSTAPSNSMFSMVSMRNYA